MAQITGSKPISKDLTSWLILLFLAIVWGLSFLFIKKLVSVLSPIELGAGRIFVAALFLSPWLAKAFKSIPKERYLWIFAAGMLGNFLPAFIFSVVGSKLNSSLAGTLNSTTPIFVMIIGAFFFNAIVTKNQIIGIILGCAGSILLVFSSGTGELNFANPYALLAMVATVCYGFNVNIVSAKLKGLSPLEWTSLAFLFVGILAFGILCTTDFFTKITAEENRVTLWYLLILAGINTSLALVIFNYLVQVTSAVFASSVTYLIPIVAMVAGILDGESVSIWHYLGMAVILIGVYLINRKS